MAIVVTESPQAKTILSEKYNSYNWW